MNSYEQYKYDIQNGIIKAIELVQCGNDVIRNNTHALMFKCPMAIVGFDDKNFYTRYYSKDTMDFKKNDAPFPSENYYKNNGLDFKYDGRFATFIKGKDITQYKVHKERNIWILT